MSRKVLELQQRKGELVTQERQILDAVKDGKLTAEQRDSLEKIQKDFSDIDTLISAEQRHADILAEQADKLKKQEEIKERSFNEKDIAALRKKAFNAYITGKGTDSFTAEERAIYQEALRRGQEVATDSKGGFLTYEEFDTEVIKTIKAMGGVMEVARIRSTTHGNTINIATLNDTARKAVVIAEATAASLAELAYGQKTIGAIKYTTGYFTVSNELLADERTDTTGDIVEAMGDAFYRGWNEHFTTGNGTTQPEGLITGLVAAGGTIADAVSTIAPDKLIDLVHSVDSYYRGQNSKWMFNDLTLSAIRKLKDGDGNYLWQMGDVSKGVPDTLLGYRIAINTDMPDIGANATSVVFGDLFKAYTIRRAGQMAIRRSTDINMLSDQLTLVAFARVDGKLVLPAAIKGIKHAAA